MATFAGSVLGKRDFPLVGLRTVFAAIRETRFNGTLTARMPAFGRCRRRSHNAAPWSESKSDLQIPLQFQEPPIKANEQAACRSLWASRRRQKAGRPVKRNEWRSQALHASHGSGSESLTIMIGPAL
jgi:hypothetical protein